MIFSSKTFSSSIKFIYRRCSFILSWKLLAFFLLSRKIILLEEINNGSTSCSKTSPLLIILIFKPSSRLIIRKYIIIPQRYLSGCQVFNRYFFPPIKYLSTVIYYHPPEEDIPVPCLRGRRPYLAIPERTGVVSLSHHKQCIGICLDQPVAKRTIFIIQFSFHASVFRAGPYTQQQKAW